MKEIKVEEYLRLFNGMIIKWGEKGDTKIIGNEYLDYSGEYEWSCLIVKHSFNIIDLIEKGDYVNGEKVSNVDKIDNTIFIEWENGNTYSTDIVNNKFIYSIVTKEQFQSVEYRLEE